MIYKYGEVNGHIVSRVWDVTDYSKGIRVQSARWVRGRAIIDAVDAGIAAAITAEDAWRGARGDRPPVTHVQDGITVVVGVAVGVGAPEDL